MRNALLVSQHTLCRAVMLAGTCLYVLLLRQLLRMSAPSLAAAAVGVQRGAGAEGGEVWRTWTCQTMTPWRTRGWAKVRTHCAHAIGDARGSQLG